ncbi:hypothetical protein B0D78_11985 [Pyramidobacter sp. C12-8]|nr:hypothetical protein B0D78_11985 [Pyramidobacter sp. C12-8]
MIFQRRSSLSPNNDRELFVENQRQFFWLTMIYLRQKQCNIMDIKNQVDNLLLSLLSDKVPHNCSKKMSL